MSSELEEALDWAATNRSGMFGLGSHVAVLAKAARDVANGKQIYRCSQHGFRGTPRCNDNPACSLQLGVWVVISTEEATDGD